MSYARSQIPAEPKGVVYTRPWVVSLLLDLAGYVPDANLADSVAVEPAAGEGAFLVPMAQRLIASCLQHDRPLSACASSLIAYELDEASAETARHAVIDGLKRSGVHEATAVKP